jgi:PAS domain S-box-containing protein
VESNDQKKIERLEAEIKRLQKVEVDYGISQKYSSLMENANKQLDERVLELSLLNEISKKLSSSLDHLNVASSIFSFLRQKMNFTFLVIDLYSNFGDNIIAVTDHDLSKEMKAKLINKIKSMRSDNSVGLDGEDNIIILDKVLGDYENDLHKPFSCSDVKNKYEVDLKVSDKEYGRMLLLFCGENNITNDEERFINIVANQMSFFIENDAYRQNMTLEKNKLESVLESITGAVLVVDESKKVILVNPITEMFLGVKKENILGKDLDDVIPHKEIKALFDVVHRQQSRIFTKEIKIISIRDNITRNVKANLAKVYDYLGKVIGTVLVLNDITKEKEVDRMKTEFISLTSHELRTPLASIKEAISLIYDKILGPITDDQHKFLGLAKRNIERLSRLINNLLDLSRIESGKMQFKKSLEDVNDLANDVYLTFKPLAADRKINLSFKQSDKLSDISIDRDKIIQVITNCVSNALKFTESDGAVEISTDIYSVEENKVCKKYILVAVKDTGVGIDKKDFDKVFSKFQQVDTSFTRKVSGTGLGLAISKEIVEIHGGLIWLESEVNKGSTFKFILPLVYGDEDLSDKKKILVIDDEVDLCLSAQRRLEANNYRVYVANSGEEGLKMVRQYRPNVIILDIMMPKMDGYEVCRYLKMDPLTSSIPIIILTALEHDDAAKKALSMGADGYLVKPFETESLLFTINEFLK